MGAMNPSLTRPLQLKVRLSEQEQRAFLDAAAASGQKLSEWVRSVLRAAVERRGE